MTRREQDERVLRMVRLRASGKSLIEISRAVGASSGNVSTMTNAIMDADIDHCGADVASAYWERKGV